MTLECFQSNHEGALIDKLHDNIDTAQGALVNPAGLTQHGVPLHDAIKAMPFPVIEVHMSNIAAREPGAPIRSSRRPCAAPCRGSAGAPTPPRCASLPKWPPSHEPPPRRQPHELRHQPPRRTASAAALAASTMFPAWAQAKTLRFAAVFSDKDIRADMMKMFAKDIEADFKVELFLNSTLFKQGTELVALQRDNLEMGNIAPQDFSKQVPAWSILTSAYLFRDANHLNAFFASEPGAQMKKMVEDQVKVKILGPTFFGTRQVGLKPKKKITTPADLAGVKLRMPPGDAWQLLGRSLGANPTPMAYAETYTGLQTGAIDGQDNPLPNVQNMKFYEVMSQIVLTSHLVAFDLLTMNLKTWQAMSPAQQAKVQAAADKAIAWSAAEHTKREAELAEGFRKQGLEVYVPNINAFREHAQKVYLASDEAKAWPSGLLDKINAMK